MVRRTPTSNPGSTREAWSRPTARVDWLQGGMAPAEPATGADPVCAWLADPHEPITQPRGFRGYNTWRQDALGTLLGLRLDNDRLTGEMMNLASFLVLKGTGLATMRADGIDDFGILRQFRNWRGRVTRIDLAVDVRHPEVTPSAFFRQYHAGQIVTRLKKPGFWGDADSGETFYLGAGDCLLRIYDKSKERKARGAHLEDGVTRLELQLRKRSAKAAMQQLAAVDPESWDGTFPELVIGWILNKARPLGRKVPRNPNRIPTWEPLTEALAGIGPVQLGREDSDRNAKARLRAQLEHFQNNLGHLELVRRLLGDAKFLQAVKHGKMNLIAVFLATFADENPEQLAETLRDLDLPGLGDDQKEPELWP